MTGGPPWANVSNTPFRQHKNTNFEGGIASPLIAWWPGVIAKPGAISPELSHITDITATCLDVAGVAYPAEFNGRQVLPLAGKSLLPVLQGGRRDGHRRCAGRPRVAAPFAEGPWKLVAGRGGPWELYNLDDRPFRTQRPGAAAPERVQAMAATFAAWRQAGSPEQMKPPPHPIFLSDIFLSAPVRAPLLAS